MENFSLIIAGALGSAITLLLTALLDLLKAKYMVKLEMTKLLFLRKTDAVEKAISWLQESIDCYRMMQTACNDIDDKYNQFVVEKMINSSAQARKLYNEAEFRLNPIYLYYNFDDVEKKFNLKDSYAMINHCIKAIDEQNKLAISINEQGIEKKEEVNLKTISLYKDLSKVLEYHIGASAEMIVRLRKDYRKYNN